MMPRPVDKPILQPLIKMSKEERIEYLEEERKKIWGRLTVIEELIDKKTSDYEADAKTSAEQANELRISAEAANVEILQNLEESNTILKDVRENFELFEKLLGEIKANSENATTNYQFIQNIYSNIEDQSEKVEQQISEIQKIFDSKPQLEENLLKLETIFKKGDDFDSKFSSLNKSINDRKKEIDELYYEIIGYTDEDENGNETEVKGLKAELENSYNLLKKKMEDSDADLKKLSDDSTKWFDDFSKEKKEDFFTLKTKWSNEYIAILNKIETLLPRALTTGLSYAYSEKKSTEEKESSNHRKSFNIAIGGLVSISLIPFFISLVSLTQGTELEEVIMRVPRIVLAILPLYLPVLWVAYSANRKMNLAKRLIEEYSHKEVLSKTFEGLSKQIDSIENKDISADLRVKLLYNILEVNSENPGKLISDYNKSDHPLMDALDKSIKTHQCGNKTF